MPPRLRKKKEVTNQGILITIRLKPEFLERVDAFCRANGYVRSVFIRKSLERSMAVDDTFSEKDQQKIVASALRLDEALDKKLAEAMARRENLLDDLDSKALAQLVIGRVPKMDVGDRELHNDALDLRDCLKALPDNRNFSHALSAERLENDEIMARLRVLEKKVAIYEKNDGVVSEDLLDFCKTVFEESLRFVGEMVALREIPGYANGKCCLSERQRELSDKAVLKGVERMLTTRRDYNKSKEITAEVLNG